MSKTDNQSLWVKEFRKAVKASTPKGWLVMQGKKESTRVQIRKDGRKIADISIPYKWEEKFWPDALVRISAAAKAYEESGHKLDLRTCFKIEHTVSSKTKIKWEDSIEAYKEFKKNSVKDSTWCNKYYPVFKNVIKATRKSSKAPLNGQELCEVALKQWQQGTQIRRHMRLALFGFLRLCVQEQQFESTWLPPALTDKDLVTTKKGLVMH